MLFKPYHSNIRVLAAICALALAPAAHADATNFAPSGNYSKNSNLSINEGLGDHSATQTLKMNGNTLQMNGGTLNMQNGKITNLGTPTTNAGAANKEYVDDAIAAAVAPLPTTDSDTTYSAGTGITLSGTTIKFNTSYGDGRYALKSRTVTAGDGLTGGGNLSANRTLSLAANQVRRTAGDGSAGVLSYAGSSATTAGQFNSSSTNPTSGKRLNYNGDLYATEMYSTSYFYFSDRNMKKDIQTLKGSDARNMVQSLRPVSYVWKENGEPALGLIAQEVELVVPTAVTTNEAGDKAVDYVQLIAPLLATVQQLDDQVEHLQARIDELEAASE
jgi:hypothetical protein